MRILFSSLFTLLLVISTIFNSLYASEIGVIHTASAHEHGYYCPMHPEKTSDKMGRCPVCNMFLVKKTQDSKPLAIEKLFNEAPSLNLNSEVDHVNVKYICPMHPHIISDVQGSCPICGMDLEKVAINDGSNNQQIEINVSGAMQQALAIRTDTVTRKNLWKYTKTLGEVAYDQGNIQHIHARVKGWVESLAIESAGDTVKKGQLLYTLFSPDLINAQDDFLLAIQANQPANDYQDLINKAGTRLELLGMTRSQVKALAKSGKTQYRVPFYAKSSGIVKKLNIRQGMYIEPQTEVMSLVNLGKVWVIANVFEQEQSWLTLGMEAEISIPSQNINKIKGKVDYIYPELDPVTRSLRVKVIIENPAQNLLPNTLAKVAIFGGAKKQVLVIPQEALIQTSKENRVIIKLNGNRFTVKKVLIGMISKGQVEVISGLKENDIVVTSGQFLLDSEASLKGSLNRLSNSHQH